MSGSVDGGEKDVYDDINITPMLDLAYVLMVIFIIMTTASVQGIKVNLPKASDTPSLAKPQTKAITITADGTMYLDTYPVSLPELENLLRQYKAANPNLPVIVKADSTIPYQRVIDVLDVVGQPRHHPAWASDPAHRQVAEPHGRKSVRSDDIYRALRAACSRLLLIAGFVWFVHTMMASEARQAESAGSDRADHPTAAAAAAGPTAAAAAGEDRGAAAEGPAGTRAQRRAAAGRTHGPRCAGIRRRGRIRTGRARAAAAIWSAATADAMFAWYTNRLKDAMLEKLAADPYVKSQKFSMSVRVWIEADGRIKDVKLATSTGNKDLDKRDRGGVGVGASFDRRTAARNAAAGHFEDRIAHMRLMSKGT